MITKSARMRIRFILVAPVAVLSLDVLMVGRAQKKERLNHVIDLLVHKQLVFGVSWPANSGGRRGGEAPPARPAIDLAKDALG